MLVKLDDNTAITGWVNFLDADKLQFIADGLPNFNFEFITLEAGKYICTANHPSLEGRVSTRIMHDIYFEALFNSLPDNFSKNDKRDL